MFAHLLTAPAAVAHPQTDKQRLIWAYKILFLDVLFPLGIDRIIFVDSDQVDTAAVNGQVFCGGWEQMYCSEGQRFEGSDITQVFGWEASTLWGSARLKLWEAWMFIVSGRDITNHNHTLHCVALSR